jgi:hypothetical protein
VSRHGSISREKNILIHLAFGDNDCGICPDRIPERLLAGHFVLQSFSIGMLNIVIPAVFIPLFLILPAKAQLNNNVLHLFMLFIWALLIGSFS